MNRVLAVLVAGALFGVAIRLTWNLPGHDLDWVSRVAWPWLLAAFAVGLTGRHPYRGARDGALLLSAATVGYYSFMWIFQGAYAHSPVGLWWVLIAVPAGALAGAAGAAVRRGPHTRRALAAGLFAALVVAEAFGTTHEITHALHDLRAGAHDLAE